MKQGIKETEIGFIPKDWSFEPLGKYASFRTGPFGSALHKSDYINSGVPVINPMHIIDGKIEPKASMSVTDHAAKNLEEFRLKPHEIIIGRRGDMGRCAVVQEHQSGWLCGTGSMIIRPIQIDPNFLQLILSSPRAIAAIENSSVGTTMVNLNQNTLSELKIQFPSLPEQQTIATALSDIDALIDGLSKLITKKRDIKQATMQQLLTGETRLPGFNQKWEIKFLGHIAEIIMGQSPSSANYNSTGKGLPLIQGNADISNRETIRRIYTTQITKKGKNGDILMSVRAPVGEISRAVFDVCLGRGVCAIRFPNGFLYHYLIFIESHWIKHSKGSTFDSVNSSDIKAVEIYMPTQPEEQNAIAQVLSDMDNEIAALEKRLEKTRLLKQGMMQELLTGRIRLV